MDKEKTYKVKSNNYVGLLFFALVLASLLYIIKHETPTFKDIDTKPKAIITSEKEPTIIEDETEQIKDLENYLNPGDINTFKIYQSMYILNNTVSIDNINNETLLYLAYKYIEKNTDFSKNLKYITCEEANKVNLEANIIECGGTKYNASYYTVNSYITKDILKKTIQKLYNININNFTNFYTSEDNVCYYLENEYMCVSHTTGVPTKYPKKEFVKAIKYDNKIEILEKYKFIDNSIYYKGFNSKEVGESQYVSTFEKINGLYYWTKTESYLEN